jgi:FAD/FMN-containing dehydrogenase
MNTSNRLAIVQTEISEVVGPQGIVGGAAAEAYLVDVRALFHGKAALIVRPRTREEVSRIVAICNRAGVAIVPQGGNTGYCGGATPDQSGSQILLNLGKMDGVVDIDASGMTMTVRAGTILKNAQTAAAEHDLLFPLSMGSEGSCQIGGCLSTNAGGLAVLRYGSARDLVLGLEVVMPDGRIWEELSVLRKDNTGYDLKQMFIGAEGTLGVITAAVVKLFARPTARHTAMFTLADIAAAGRLLQLSQALAGEAISAFEYISATSMALVTEHTGLRAPTSGSGPRSGKGGSAHVLVELSGIGNDEGLAEVVTQIYEQGTAKRILTGGVIASSEQQRLDLWALRESIPDAEKQAGGSIKHDISVPLKCMAAFVLMGGMAVTKGSARAKISVFGHLGDGNLHYNVMTPTDTDLAQFRNDCEAEISSAIHNLAVALAGSFSAEHGIGQLKRDLLGAHKGALTLELMRKIKDSIDPTGIMNPGKVL